MMSEKYNIKPLRTDGYGGWEAEQENCTLKLQFNLPFDGSLRSNFTRTVLIVYRTSDHGGKAEIWLENDKPGIVVDAYSPFGHTRLTTVAHNVTFGSHVLMVRVVKAGEFQLCGIMSGAKSVPYS